MSWLLFTMIAVGSRSAYGVASKVFSSRVPVSPSAQTVLFGAVGMLVVLVACALGGGISIPHSTIEWILLFIIFLSNGVGNLVYFIAQKGLTVASTQMGFSSILIWNVVFSFLVLHESFSLMQGVGVVVMMVAIAVSQRVGRTLEMKKEIWIVIASAAIFSAANVMTAMLSRRLPAPTVILALFVGMTLIPALLLPRQVYRELTAARRLPLTTLWPLPLCVATSLGYQFFQYLALRHAAHQGVVLAIMTGQVVGGVLLSAWLLRERHHLGHKILAALLALMAGALIKG